MGRNGSLIVSLDFELMWGCKDWATVEGYGESNIKNVPEVINGILDILKKYEVHATFAVVGMIMYKDKETLLKNLPREKPTYADKTRSPYEENYIEKIEARDAALYFQPGLVEELKQHNNVEIATHTFCHYNCHERGQTLNQFESDIRKAIEDGQKNGILIESIVFPKNKVSDAYLKVCKKNGIVSFRGNARKYFGEHSSALGRCKDRLCRLLDTFFPLNTQTCYSYDDLEIMDSAIPLNIPASRFFRPYSSKLFFLEPLKLRRIKQEIRNAAIHGEVYHIWWHPHNFGLNIEKNLKELDDVLSYFSWCRDKYEMQSYTMKELATNILNKNGKL